jgi:hypothetical protein
LSCRWRGFLSLASLFSLSFDVPFSWCVREERSSLTRTGLLLARLRGDFVRRATSQWRASLTVVQTIWRRTPRKSQSCASHQLGTLVGVEHQLPVARSHRQNAGCELSTVLARRKPSSAMRHPCEAHMKLGACHPLRQKPCPLDVPLVAEQARARHGLGISARLCKHPTHATGTHLSPLLGGVGTTTCRGLASTLMVSTTVHQRASTDPSHCQKSSARKLLRFHQWPLSKAA